MITLDKKGETDFQKNISIIIKEKIKSNYFNPEQEEAIRTIWGLSQSHSRSIGGPSSKQTS